MGECLLWEGPVRSDGYGAFPLGSRSDGTRRTQRAHQWAYERERGQVPLDPSTGRKFPLDHTCHNEAAARGECDGGSTCPHRRCVNVDHLIVSTVPSNTLSSPLPAGSVNRAKTHCVRGHVLSGENLYVDPRGRRGCRTCRSDNSRRAEAKRRRGRS